MLNICSDRKMANEAVLKYLVDTNRPYSCADVTVNLRGAFGKTAIQKALDALSEAGKIKCKVYGKQKVYAAIQIDDVVDENESDDFDARFANLTKALEVNTTSLKEAENKLKLLTSTPTTTSASEQIKQTTEKIKNFDTKLLSLRTSVEFISADDKKKILDEHAKFLREYRKRKRICNDMLEAVLEGYPKSKKVLLDELCIETDELVNFELKSLKTD